MKHIYGNRFFALLFIVSLIIVSLFSYGLIMANMDHDCADKACKTCVQITYWINNLRLISSAIIWTLIILSFLNLTFFFNLQQKYFKNQLNSLVWLKVRLNF
jgi:hypothetical protein